jgi:hypothetical protein
MNEAVSASVNRIEVCIAVSLEDLLADNLLNDMAAPDQSCPFYTLR